MSMPLALRSLRVRESTLPMLFLLCSALYVSGEAYATDEDAFSYAATPHIALILPLQSDIFGAAAEVVKQGFMAADTTKAKLPVQVYECANESEEVVALYQQAVADGAVAIVGPLTRKGVAVLANYSDIAVPTLALNVAEVDTRDKLFFFSLAQEAEARQIAKISTAAGLHTATIINSGSASSERLAQAFAEEWATRGGSIIKEILYQNDPSVLAGLPRTKGNMIFLAVDARRAHLLRPYIKSTLPVYATSQIFNGNANALTNYDLNGVHFIDMPWLLQPDHPAVMIYPHINPPLKPPMERLYALGLDAFRLLQIMLYNRYDSSLPLDGVTGLIRLNSHQQFQREGVSATFNHGLGLTSEGFAARRLALSAAKKAQKNNATNTATTIP